MIDEPRTEIQSAVLDCFVHAAVSAAVTKDWEDATDVFLRALGDQGYEVVRSGAIPPWQTRAVERVAAIIEQAGVTVLINPPPTHGSSNDAHISQDSVTD